MTALMLMLFLSVLNVALQVAIFRRVIMPSAGPDYRAACAVSAGL